MSVELKVKLVLLFLLVSVLLNVFCSKLYTIHEIADDADMDLFRIIAKPHHCVYSIPPSY